MLLIKRKSNLYIEKYKVILYTVLNVNYILYG